MPKYWWYDGHKGHHTLGFIHRKVVVVLPITGIALRLFFNINQGDNISTVAQIWRYNRKWNIGNDLM